MGKYEEARISKNGSTGSHIFVFFVQKGGIYVEKRSEIYDFRTENQFAILIFYGLGK